jgi:hypothetical protein
MKGRTVEGGTAPSRDKEVYDEEDAHEIQEENRQSTDLSHRWSVPGLHAGFVRDADVSSVYSGDNANPAHIHAWTIFHIFWISPDPTSRVASGGDRRFESGRTGEGFRTPD